MVGFLRRLMPREDKFFDMFEAHAGRTLAAAKILAAIFDDGAEITANCHALMKVEEEADALAAQVSEGLRKSFVTPFDRGDIKNLISSMDDAVDEMNKTAKAVLLYEVKTFPPEMKLIAGQAVEMAGLLVEALPLLRKAGANASRLHVLCKRMAMIEDESDRHHEAGLKALLKGKARTDAMAFIVGSDLLGHVEKVADKLEDVAHTVDGIVIEHV